jgi:LysM repeat protein
VARADLPPPSDYRNIAANNDEPGAPRSQVEGITIRMGVGETLSSVSRRYGVPLSTIARANGIADPSRVQAGQRIYIPGATQDTRYAVASADDTYFGANSANRPGRTAPGPSVLGTLPASSADPYPDDVPAAGRHLVAPGETLGGIAEQYGVSRSEILATNDISDPNRIREGQRLIIPRAGDNSGRMIASANGPRRVATTEIGPDSYGRDYRLNDDIPPTTSSLRRPQNDDAIDGPAGYTPPESATTSIASLDPSDRGSADGQQFRWPVRGRIISGFGAKPNGERNDGINLAVPEGTSIKAAGARSSIPATKSPAMATSSSFATPAVG